MSDVAGFLFVGTVNKTVSVVTFFLPYRKWVGRCSGWDSGLWRGSQALWAVAMGNAVPADDPTVPRRVSDPRGSGSVRVHAQLDGQNAAEVPDTPTVTRELNPQQFCDVCLFVFGEICFLTRTGICWSPVTSSGSTNWPTRWRRSPETERTPSTGVGSRRTWSETCTRRVRALDRSWTDKSTNRSQGSVESVDRVSIRSFVSAQVERSRRRTWRRTESRWRTRGASIWTTSGCISRRRPQGASPSASSWTSWKVQRKPHLSPGYHGDRRNDGSVCVFFRFSSELGRPERRPEDSDLPSIRWSFKVRQRDQEPHPRPQVQLGWSLFHLVWGNTEDN